MKFITYYMHACMQILQVVNPSCTYAVGEKKGHCAGVAVLLKEFLNQLDARHIDHYNESQIRKTLRLRKDVKTTATQFFLKPGSNSKSICRKNNNCRHCSCLIIPHSDLPDSFFEVIQDYQAEGNNLL